MTKCAVCGLPSNGVHYGVASCGGCAVFYKRGRTRPNKYKCIFGGKCFDTERPDFRCKACRYQRCLDVGMDPHATVRGRRPKERDYKISSSAEDNEAHDLPTQATFSGKFGQYQWQKYPVSLNTPTAGKSTSLQNPFLRRNDFPLRSTTAVSQMPAVEPKITEHEAAPLFTNSHQMETAQTLQNRVSLGSLIKTKIIDDQNGALVTRIIYYNSMHPERNSRWKLNDMDNDELSLMLTNFSHIMNRNDFRQTNTIHIMADAICQSVGDMIDLWDNFKNSVYKGMELPVRRNIPFEEVMETFQTAFTGFIKRACRLFTLLPGFSDFDESDRDAMLAEKFTETWLVILTPYMINGEWTVLIGPNQDIHLNHFFTNKMLSAEFRQTVFRFAEQLNDIQLTHLERFLFLAVAVFHPDYTTAKNKALLTFLHKHYMQCLLHCIQNRCSTVEEAFLAEQKLQNFMVHFRNLYRFGKFYVRSMSYTSLPFIPVKGSPIASIEEAFAQEDDGLTPKSKITSPPLLKV